MLNTSYQLPFMEPLSLSLEERIENYHSKNPNFSPLIVFRNRIYGFWLVGNYYASDSSLYGSYPATYLKRVMSIFPDCYSILHLFSGSILGDGIKIITYDIKEEMKPNVCDDVVNILSHFQNNTFDLILADPPYEERDFEKYDCKPFNKSKVIKECSIITKPRGFLVWLDTIAPMFSKQDWNLMGVIGLQQSTNHRIRAISLFQKGENENL